MTEGIKLRFIHGIKEVVLDEIKQYPDLCVIEQKSDCIYLEVPQSFQTILNLRSINSAYIAKQDPRFHPKYLTKHKSILGDMITSVVEQDKKAFKSFRIRCAGSQSSEVRDIQEYIQETFKLEPKDDAELEIYISKLEDTWEISVRLSPLPLSVRTYKQENIKGGLNPNIAYAINSFCDLNTVTSYLNIFSGSATLLIEAGIINKDIQLIGFDNDKKTNSLAIQNIKKAGLITNIQIKTADIFEDPDFGTFDAITSNLPFGMRISKGENLNELYKAFIKYSEAKLNPNGKLIIYTTEHDVLTKVLKDSKFSIIKELDLTLPTSINSYLYPKILVCQLKVV